MLEGVGKGWKGWSVLKVGRLKRVNISWNIFLGLMHLK